MGRFVSALRVGLVAGALVSASLLSMAVMSGAEAQQAPAAPTQPRKPAPAAPAAPANAAQKPALGATEEDGPSRTSATYDDWVVRCERTEASGNVKVCETAQTLQIGNPQQNLVAQVVFGKLKSDAPLRLVLQLPVGVWLPGGAALTVGDNAKPIPLTFKFCIRACIADLDLTPQQAAALSTATGGGTLTFQDRNQTQVSLPISLKGLAAALAAREKM